MIHNLDDKVGGMALTLRRLSKQAKTPVLLLAACPPGSKHREGAASVALGEIESIYRRLGELRSWMEREFHL